MAETPPMTLIVGASSSMAPAVVDNQAMASPTHSDRTVIASGMRSLSQEGIVDRGLLPVAGQGQALFSTNLGRLAPRNANPPYTPVVVRSNMSRDVVAFARSLFNKYSWQYVCYFPNCGYDIADLFDREDIHTFEPAFCKEVLKYITYDNVYRVRAYAFEWSLQNRDRLHVVAGGIYDEDDPLSVVTTVFVNGETKYHPPHFLWHAANFIRSGMYNTVEKIQETSKAVDAGEAVKVTSSATGKSDLKPKPMAEVKSKVAESYKQPQYLPLPGADPQMLHQPPMPLPDSFGVVPFQVPTQPFVTRGSMHTPRMGYPNQMPNVPMAGPSPRGHPHMVQPILKNPKNRSARQGSSSFRRPPQHAPWVENTLPVHPPGPPPGPPYRQPSGMMSMQPHHMHAQPMSSHQMMNQESFMVPPPPQNTGFMSPPMPHSQIVQPPISYGPSMMPLQPGLYSPAIMGPGPPIGQDPAGPSAMHMEDLSNNWQYAFNGNNQRMDQRVVLPRRSSRPDKQQTLYNPYGNDRPDWPTVPLQSNPRRGLRTSFSNSQGRGRRSSMAGPNRSSSGYHEPDRGEYDSIHIGGRIEPAYPPKPPKPPKPSKPSKLSIPQTSNSWQRVPSIVNDVEYGCDENWIGPKNKSVTELIVFEIPDAREEPDQKMLEFKVQDHFERNTGVSVHRVQTKIDKRDTSIARVFFHSPEDAIKGLRLNDSVLEGKKIAVKVPFHCYCINSSQGQSFRIASSTENRSPFQGQQGRRRMSHMQPGTVTIIGGKGKQKTTYSPQDARSDLPLPHGIIQDMPTEVTGSPEKSKSKNQNKPSVRNDKTKTPSEASFGENNAIQLQNSLALQETTDQGSVVAGMELKSVDIHKTAPFHTENEELTVDTKAEDCDPKVNTAFVKLEQHEHDTAVSIAPHMEMGQAPGSIITSTGSASTTSKEPSVGVSEPPHIYAEACQTEAAGTPGIVGEESNKSDTASELLRRPNRDPHARDESVSDDEQKNDNSFVSAKESQSDIEKTEPKEEFLSVIDTGVSEVSCPSTSSVPRTARAQPESAGFLSEENVVAKGAPRKPPPGPATTGVSSGWEIGTSGGPSDLSSEPSTIGFSEKKVGIHATESLNPFGMSKAQLRAQKKRGQEAKKKERKKREKEKKEREGAKKVKKGTKPIVDTNIPAQIGMKSSQQTDSSSSKVGMSPLSKNPSNTAETQIGYVEDSKKTEIMRKIPKADEGKQINDSQDVFENPHELIQSGSMQMTPNQEVPQSATVCGPPSQAAPSSSSHTSEELATIDPAKLDVERKQSQKLVKGEKVGHIKVAVPNLKLRVTKSATSSKAPITTSSPTGTLAPIEKGNKRVKVAHDSNTMGGVFDEILAYIREKEQTNTPTSSNNSAQRNADGRPAKLEWKKVEQIIETPTPILTASVAQLDNSNDGSSPKAGEEVEEQSINDDGEESEASSATISAD